MRTTGNRAFTLVELLIVIMIIGILATLVVPAVARVLELARQSACRSSVRELISGMKAYSTATQEMPNVPVSGWNVRIGTNRGSSPFNLDGGGSPPAAKQRNHSANLWLLLRGEFVPASGFVCAGTEDRPSPRQEDMDDYWDFSSSLDVSYGMQSPYGYDGSLSILTPEGVVMVADGSPYVQTSYGTNPGAIKTGADLRIADWGSGGDGVELMRRGNSPNHDGQGQNVGFWDGRAEWRTGAACGRNSDNIYTATDERGLNEDTATSAGGDLRSGIRNNPYDTLILP